MQSTACMHVKKIKPRHAEGRVNIDLIDPATRKITDCVKGKNHVFEESLFSASWISYVSSSHLLLTDSQDAVDEDFPYIPGNILGLGVPSAGSSGTIQGAYVAANQVLAQRTLTSTRWKFQYEFTTTQANGVIGTMGLTQQLKPENTRSAIEGFGALSVNTAYSYYTADGRYAYTCSTAGILTKIDLMTGTTAATIDLSATVGTTGNKYVGYAPATGRYYIFQGTTKRMYEYSDNAFSSLLNNYNGSNVSSAPGSPMYIYGNYLFAFSTSSVYRADFINNLSGTTITLNPSSLVNSNYMRAGNNTYPWGKYVVCGGTGYYSSAYNYTGQGVLFNMANSQYYPLGGQGYGGDRYSGMAFHPYYDHKLPCYVNSGNLAVNSAIAQYVLPTPVTKTSANGMIVTYEIEVFWE